MADEEVQPGPRIVMKKVQETAFDEVVRFDGLDFERIYLTPERLAQLGDPEGIEVRLEGL